MGILCKLGIHDWNIIREKHEVTGHPTGREHIRVVVRECLHCGKRQYRKNLRKSFSAHKWKTCTFDRDAKLNINEIK